MLASCAAIAALFAFFRSPSVAGSTGVPVARLSASAGATVSGAPAGTRRATHGNVTAVSVPSRARRAIELGRGGTLAGALDRLGLPADLQPTILAELDRQLDLRRLPQQTGLVATFGDDGAPLALAVRSEPASFVRISLGPAVGALRAERVELPSVRLVDTVEGRILTSVTQALAHVAHGRELTLAFADVFRWDVDLLTEPRRGDRVRIVYEVERLGGVPADVPSFGGAAARTGEFLRLGRVLAATYDGALARSTAFWVDHGGAGDYYDDRGNPLRKAFLRSPLEYRSISSRFSKGRMHPILRKVIPHHGVDFAAPSGTPVVAAADGVVTAAGWDGPLGRAVRIRHGGEIVTIYGHLRGLGSGIARGAHVRQNQVIGYVGATGRATGPHLHYTMIVRGRPIDPLKFENPPVEPLSAEARPRLAHAMRTWAPLLGAIPAASEIARAGGGFLDDLGGG
jgi:murein DD-endopeptidase MepM/ murein hydrolase activator NlpD